MADVARVLAATAGWAAAGVLAWSLAEYVLHRADMHRRRSRGATSREHRRHHATLDVPVLTAGTWVGAGVVASFLAWAALPAAGAGWMAAYVGYELLHRRIHRPPAEDLPQSGAPEPNGGDRLADTYLDWAEAHHLVHHLVDARVNYGVTSALWDVVFGTHRPAGRGAQRARARRSPVRRRARWRA